MQLLFHTTINENKQRLFPHTYTTMLKKGYVQTQIFVWCTLVFHYLCSNLRSCAQVTQMVDFRFFTLFRTLHRIYQIYSSVVARFQTYSTSIIFDNLHSTQTRNTITLGTHDRMGLDGVSFDLVRMTMIVHKEFCLLLQQIREYSSGFSTNHTIQ